MLFWSRDLGNVVLDSRVSPKGGRSIGQGRTQQFQGTRRKQLHDDDTLTDGHLKQFDLGKCLQKLDVSGLETQLVERESPGATKID